MDNGDDSEHAESGKDFEVEVAQVSRSGEVRQSRSVGRGLSTRPRFWRLVRAAGVVALVLLVLLALVLDVSGRLTPQQVLRMPPPPLTLRPQLQGMTCLLDAAWSPQDTRIALMGDQQRVNCSMNGTSQQAGLMTVYDVGSGKLLATLHPDAAIVSAMEAFLRGVAPTGPPPSPPPAATFAPAIWYQHVLWSPDGKRLALTFAFDPGVVGVNLFLPDGEPVELAGVLLVDRNGLHPQVLLHLVSAYAPSPVEWDLRADTLVVAPTPPYSCTAVGCSGPFPPALAYHWQAGGTLATDTPLSLNAPPPVPPLGPVGTPDGGSSFTIWQPGFVSGVSHLGPTGLTHLAGLYSWSTSLAAWSSDGRYLLDAITPEALLTLPGTPRPTQDEVNANGIASLGLLPLRDAGLLGVLRTVNPDDQAGTAVSWRPDGRAVAAYAPEGLFAPHRLILYDCASGRPLATLLPPATVGGTTPALSGHSIMLRWAPDGAHLLLFALALGQVVVWAPQHLPH